jgi:uncharacterized damage-inducible protein DinB
MSGTTSRDPRFPIGEFERPESLDPDARAAAIDRIASLPGDLRRLTGNLNDAQLDTPYREGGWTLRQVVHHLADSHMNAYVRLKLAITEDHPRVKSYEEARWAALVDGRTMPVEPSLRLLEALHERWVAVWRSLEPAQFERTIDHPEYGTMRVDQILAMYAWHGDHHVAHIRLASR